MERGAPTNLLNKYPGYCSLGNFTSMIFHCLCRFVGLAFDNRFRSRRPRSVDPGSGYARDHALGSAAAAPVFRVRPGLLLGMALAAVWIFRGGVLLAEEQTPLMPLAEVRAGMEGHWRTVVSGTDIQEYPLEV